MEDAVGGESVMVCFVLFLVSVVSAFGFVVWGCDCMIQGKLECRLHFRPRFPPQPIRRHVRFVLGRCNCERINTDPVINQSQWFKHVKNKTSNLPKNYLPSPRSA